MTDAIHVDVSEHQAAVFTDAYPHRFGMFRAASEYDRPDAKAPANLAWCVHARATGRLVNFGVYVIPGVVPNDAITGRLDALGVPRDCVIMIDAESWGSLVTGNHSTQFNTLAETLKTRQGGRADLVWGYLNPNVDAGLWPSRPGWLGFIQPAYGPHVAPDPRGLQRIGWQYCNAVQNGSPYPSASAPFGRCDHNIMFIDYPTPGDDVTPADIAAIVKAVNDHTDNLMQDYFWPALTQGDNSAFKGGTSLPDINAQLIQVRSALGQSGSVDATALVDAIQKMGATVAKQVLDGLAARLAS